MAGLAPDIRSVGQTQAVDVTAGMQDALANISNQINEAQQQKINQQRYDEVKIRQDELDKGNAEIKKLQIKASNRADKYEQDKMDYFKGVNDPSNYGIKPGTEKTMKKLSNYDFGNNPEFKDISYKDIKAAPETLSKDKLKKVNAYKKYVNDLDLKMKKFINSAISDSQESRVIGYALSNPNNTYAQEEAAKVRRAQTSSINNEIKNLLDKQTALALEASKSKYSDSNSKSTSKPVNKYGLAVVSPTQVTKDALDLFAINTGKAGDGGTNKKGIPPLVRKTVAELASKNYSAAQINKYLTNAYSPREHHYLTPNKEAKLDGKIDLGEPENIAYTTDKGNEYTTRLDALSKSYDKRIKELKAQKNGTYYMDELNKILNSSSINKNKNVELIEESHNPSKAIPLIKQNPHKDINIPIEAFPATTKLSKKDLKALATNPKKYSENRIKEEDIKKVKVAKEQLKLKDDLAAARIQKIKSNGPSYKEGMSESDFLKDLKTYLGEDKFSSMSDSDKTLSFIKAKMAYEKANPEDPWYTRFYKDLTVPGYFADRVKHDEHTKGASQAFLDTFNSGPGVLGGATVAAALAAPTLSTGATISGALLKGAGNHIKNKSKNGVPYTEIKNTIKPPTVDRPNSAVRYIMENFIK